MMNTTPAINTILGDIREEADALLDADDTLFADDDFEAMLPQLARRILKYEAPAATLIVVTDILARMIEDPTLIGERS